MSDLPVCFIYLGFCSEKELRVDNSEKNRLATALAGMFSFQLSTISSDCRIIFHPHIFVMVIVMGNKRPVTLFLTCLNSIINKKITF